MAAQTQIYLYNQRQYVVLLEATALATRRYQKVYAKELLIHRGVDNLLEFAFINQEQKPVDISGKEITCRILNYNGTTILIQKTLTPMLPLTGITSLQLTAAEIEGIDHQQCYYSLEIPVNSFDYPVFVDAAGGARGVIRIVNSVLPSFVESHTVTIPSHLRPKTSDPKTYYSSTYYTKEQDQLTFQYYLDNFTGSVQFQASTLLDFSYYYDLTAEEYHTAYTGPKHVNFQGYHPFIRMRIVNDGTGPADTDGFLFGDVTYIYVR